MSASEVLDPSPREPFEIGEKKEFTVRVKPMRTRELMKLLKILTRGAYWLIPTIMESEGEDVVESLIAALIVAVPEAEDATMDFVKAMVVLDEASAPKGADYKAASAALNEYVDNPALDDLLTVLEKVVRAEGEDLSALGNRVSGMLTMAQKSGQIPETDPNEKTDSSDQTSLTDTSEALI